MRSTTPTAAVLIVLFCIAGMAVSPAVAQSQQVRTPNATMVFTDQTTNGTTVQLNSVNLSQGGFVAIHNASLTTQNDTVGSVIGVSERLSPGPIRTYRCDSTPLRAASSISRVCGRTSR
ncbi:DUF7282 domain-containing protein [Halococcus sp. AFM35]|uniref:DUF7282 domain-containing protein n=1 Tax=Halococcus sp. AFM35 TaxID=3421653 RepID=UPI003EC0207B